MSWADLPQIARVIAALIFIIALMGGLSLLLKKLGLSDHKTASPKNKRLKLIETLALDARRRLAIIECDEKQHLIVLGPDSETIVENNIKSIQAVQTNIKSKGDKS